MKQSDFGQCRRGRGPSRAGARARVFYGMAFALAVLGPATAGAQNLLLNGDFESVITDPGIGGQYDYAVWVEGGNGTRNNEAGWSTGACSGGHGSYSPGLATWWFCDTAVHQFTLAQTVDLAEPPGTFHASICWAGENWCIAVPDHTQPQARIVLEFYDQAGGTGTLLATEDSGYMNHTAVSQEEVELLFEGSSPPAAQSVVMTLHMSTGSGSALGCGNCGPSNDTGDHFTVVAHSASLEIDTAPPPTPGAGVEWWQGLE